MLEFRTGNMLFALYVPKRSYRKTLGFSGGEGFESRIVSVIKQDVQSCSSCSYERMPLKWPFGLRTCQRSRTLRGIEKP